MTDKTCGEGFNERTYKIINKGDGDCLHSELYKEKVPLRPCGYAEKCEKDLDCKSNKCNGGFCDFEFVFITNKVISSSIFDVIFSR